MPGINVQLAVLLTYSALMIGLGLWIGRRVSGTKDFFVAGRRLGPGLIFATMLAANIGAGSTVNATALGYQNGLAAWWWVGSAAIGSFVLAVWVGPAMRRLAEQHDFRTVGDFLELRYNRSVRITVSALLWFGSLAILASQLIGIARIVEPMLGVPKYAGCLIGGVVITAYFAAGGLLTSAWVNVVQLTVKLAGFAIALPLALAGIGGWSALSAAPAPPDYWSPWQSGGSGWMYLAMLGPAFVVSPGLLQKIYGARDDRAVRIGVGMNALGLLLYAPIPALLGMIAHVRFPSLPNQELALATIFMQGVPPIVGGLGLAAVFSAEISAADATLFMLTTSLSQDLYKRFMNPEADDLRVLAIARGTAIAAGALGIAIAIAAPTIIVALSIFYTLLGVSLFVPVLAGLYTRRAGTVEAMASIACGVATTVAAQLFTRGQGLGVATPAMIGLGAAIVGFTIVFAVHARSAPGPIVRTRV
jgi:SSS family solute:Na+ symporter